MERTNGAGGERAADAGERDVASVAGAGIPVRFRDHHRRSDEVGHHDAGGGDDRLVGYDPPDHAGARERDHDRLGRAQASAWRIESRKMTLVRTAWTPTMIRLHDAPSAPCERHATTARTPQMSQVPGWGRVLPRTVSRM